MGGEAPRDCFSQRKWGNEVVGLPKKKKKRYNKRKQKGKEEGWDVAAWRVVCSSVGGYALW
jgi:hypothetical protein